VLKEKVKELEQRCNVLTVENETLKAEVEIYRSDAGVSGLTAGGGEGKGGTPGGETSNGDMHDLEHFVKCGDGTYVKSKEVLLNKLHGLANPSCCSLSNDDTILATGGADGNLALVQWGAALGGKEIMDKVVRIECGAPVIAVDFARKPRSRFCAAGCMDGSVHVVHVETHSGLEAKEIAMGTIKHAKYVRMVAWSSGDLLATSSADGCVQIHKVVWNGLDDNIKLERVETLNLSASVESLCFHKDFLVCFVRGTPFLSYFDITKNFELTKHNLNQGPGNAGFSDHVSFCVMDMAPFGDYLALATDTSRNMIVDFASGKQIRNLYGHQNDGFSQPKIAWSQNGQYLYGNTQDESALVVWDIASAKIVDRLEGHGNNIRDLFSSKNSDTVVTTSFDKRTHIWLTPMD
jgi:WD40 repeat protein